MRVAYPVQAGLTDFDEFGNYSGYTYEYLEEIAQYTGWDYEFVQAPGTMDDSLSTLMGMLQEGEIDLMGAMLYTCLLYTSMGRKTTIVVTVEAMIAEFTRFAPSTATWS